jgi:ribosomal protein S18 acetylase RimI-like enzyme
LELRAWEGAEDTTAMQRLASRLWPFGLHPGGLGWAATRGRLADLIVIEGSGAPAGWAAVDRHHSHGGGELHVQAGPARPEVVRALVEWGIAAGGDELSIAVAHGDEALAAAVKEAGFTPDPEAGPLVGPLLGMFRPAVPGRPRLPSGYRVRSVRDDELEVRVECHREAWRPTAMPLPPETLAEIPPDATSSFNMDLYDRVRNTWLYDQSLDLVVEAPDGNLAACCIVWWDPAIGVAEIEPLGVVPGQRRLGLARALCTEALARVEARGGRTVFINSSPNPAYPAPSATYAAAGFELVERGRAFCRRRRRAGVGQPFLCPTSASTEPVMQNDVV